MPQSNGGVNAISRLTLFPMMDYRSGVSAFYAFDPAGGFDDPVAEGFYSFKVEEVLPGRKPTVGQAIIQYRDLGVCTVTLRMSGIREDNQSVVTQDTVVTWGNAVPTGAIMTKIFGLNFPACFNPQLTILRAPGAGPVSIAKVVLCGRVEVGQVFQ